MGGVLDGIRVVELGVWVAGPSVAGLMADWGADVVKVESPSGDPFRWLFASIGYNPDLPNPPFALDNRGKRSAVVDTRSPEGQAVVDRLLAGADVFVTNLRPDALDRMGLSPAAVAERHPRLVYASVTGYGLSGPDRDRAAYDVGAFWARTGIARQLVPPDQPPPGIRGGLGDHATGLATVAGVLAALLERERTGRGRVVETSLLRTGMYCLGWDLGIQLVMGKVAPASPREASPTPLLNSYQDSEGRWFFLIGLEADRHFPGLVRAVGRPELLEDERFATASARRRHGGELIALFDAVFVGHTMEHWAQAFAAEDVWWAPVHGPEDVVADPQAEAAGAFVEVEDPAGAFRAVAAPVRFHGAEAATAGAVPRLGEHTDAVLAEAGYRPDEVEALRNAGVVPG